MNKVEYQFGHNVGLSLVLKQSGCVTDSPGTTDLLCRFQEEVQPQEDSNWFLEPPYGLGADMPPGYEAPIMYTARCFCRRVEFYVTEPPTAAKICDCTACQQLHGAPLQWAALFQKTSVHFAPRSRDFLNFYNIGLDCVYTNGGRRELPCKVRCYHCGTWVADEGRNMFMAFPTLFDFTHLGGETPACFQPQCRIFCTAKQNLENTDSKYGLPCFIDDRRTPATPGDLLRYIVPSLDGSRYKGQCGKIGIIGGSPDYAGAPYFAGAAALKAGADMVYVFTAQEAATAIKSYSPELMVMPVYEIARMQDEAYQAEEIDAMVRAVTSQFHRLTALCIGPGLGRDPNVLAAVELIIDVARDRQISCVIDADALHLLIERPGVVKGYTRACLTPNAAEYRRFEEASGTPRDVASVAGLLGGPLVLRKAQMDCVEAPNLRDPIEWEKLDEGAPRRPGGLGDILAGVTSTILAWSAMAEETFSIPKDARPWAVLAACEIVRQATSRAYKRTKRAMLASDVLEEIGPVFEEMCPSDTKGLENNK